MRGLFADWRQNDPGIDLTVLEMRDGELRAALEERLLHAVLSLRQARPRKLRQAEVMFPEVVFRIIAEKNAWIETSLGWVAQCEEAAAGRFVAFTRARHTCWRRGWLSF
jgi:hypothetical protein